MTVLGGVPEAGARPRWRVAGVVALGLVPMLVVPLVLVVTGTLPNRGRFGTVPEPCRLVDTGAVDPILPAPRRGLEEQPAGVGDASCDAVTDQGNYLDIQLGAQHGGDCVVLGLSYGPYRGRVTVGTELDLAGVIVGHVFDQLR